MVGCGRREGRRVRLGLHLISSIYLSLSSSPITFKVHRELGKASLPKPPKHVLHIVYTTISTTIRTPPINSIRIKRTGSRCISRSTPQGRHVYRPPAGTASHGSYHHGSTRGTECSPVAWLWRGRIGRRSS